MTFEIIKETRNNYDSIPAAMLHPDIINFINDNNLICYHKTKEDEQLQYTEYVSFVHTAANVIDIMIYDVSNMRYAVQNAILRIKG